MSGDYPVTSRSDEEVRKQAKRLLAFAGASDREPVNVIALAMRGEIWTVFGLKRLVFLIEDDRALGKDDAITSFGEGVVTIRAKRSVHRDALLGVGRARMTIAHELGHAVMHQGPPMARGTGARGRAEHRWIRPFESAEHQAKVFAAALLINDVTGEPIESAEDVAVRFGVSLEAGEIYYKEHVERRDRPQTAERIRRKADDFQQSLKHRDTPLYLDDPRPMRKAESASNWHQALVRRVWPSR